MRGGIGRGTWSIAFSSLIWILAGEAVVAAGGASVSIISWDDIFAFFPLVFILYRDNIEDYD
jgi:hypothetical protein